MKFDPESYTISIRKEEHYGEVLYVGRVSEFPNISAFEETFEEARSLVIDSIKTLKKIADETHAEFPIPYPAPSDEFSGRLTLRLPKSLHAKVSKFAEQDDVSVNQFLVTAIAYYVGETDGISKVVSAATVSFGQIFNHAISTAVTSVASWITIPYSGNIVTTQSGDTPSFLCLAQSKVHIGAMQ